jgi:hypothetical protein
LEYGRGSEKNQQKFSRFRPARSGLQKGAWLAEISTAGLDQPIKIGRPCVLYRSRRSSIS